MPRLLSTIATLLGACLVSIPAASASPPLNDRLNRAIEISSLPFEMRQDTTEATTSGPRMCSRSSSVFYSFTPDRDVMLHADTFGSKYDTVLTVFTGSHGAYELVTCDYDRITLDSALGFNAESGVTYFFMIGSCCSYTDDEVGGRLTFVLTEEPATDLEVIAEPDYGTLHPGHILRLTGTAECNQRSEVQIFGYVRQLRDEMFVARGRIFTTAQCRPGETALWHAWIDSAGDIAFGEGHASARSAFMADTGSKSLFSSATRQTFPITRASGDDRSFAVSSRSRPVSRALG